MFRVIALALVLSLLLGGCSHYKESIDYWQAPEHEAVREWYEVPLAILLTPVHLVSLGLYPFEQDKERPSFVELSAVWVLLVDPTRNVDQSD